MKRQEQIDQSIKLLKKKLKGSRFDPSKYQPKPETDLADVEKIFWMDK